MSLKIVMLSVMFFVAGCGTQATRTVVSGAEPTVKRSLASESDYQTIIFESGNRYLKKNNLPTVSIEKFHASVGQDEKVCELFAFCGATGSSNAKAQDFTKALIDQFAANGNTLDFGDQQYRFQKDLTSPDFKLSTLVQYITSGRVR